jgi:sialic acid synthase SpsE
LPKLAVKSRREAVSRALDLVKIAAECGADAIKLQVFRATQLMHTSSAVCGLSEGSVRGERRDGDVAAVRADALTECQNIAVYAADFGLATIATPFSPGDVEIVESLNLPAVKIASPDVVNRPLLSRASRAGRPLLVSTGAATMEEIAMGRRGSARGRPRSRCCTASVAIRRPPSTRIWRGSESWRRGSKFPSAIPITPPT